MHSLAILLIEVGALLVLLGFLSRLAKKDTAWIRSGALPCTPGRLRSR